VPIHSRSALAASDNAKSINKRMALIADEFRHLSNEWRIKNQNQNQKYMKNKMLVIVNLLVLGAALTGVLSSSAVGTVVTNPEELTRITGGADCPAYQSSSCAGGTSCGNGSCVVAGGTGWYGNKGKTTKTDCSSKDTNCGSVWYATACD
jgi:hypothetical protein